MYLELVQDKVFFDVVSHLVQFWESIAKTVAQAENGGVCIGCEVWVWEGVCGEEHVVEVW